MNLSNLSNDAKVFVIIIGAALLALAMSLTAIAQDSQQITDRYTACVQKHEPADCADAEK